jgi:hypothetical protein
MTAHIPVSKDFEDDNGKTRVVQITDNCTDDGDRRYTVFARFNTSGYVDIVSTTYIFEDNKVTTLTQSVDIGCDEFDALIEAWHSWEPFGSKSLMVRSFFGA